MHVVHTGLCSCSAAALAREQWWWMSELQNVHVVNCCCMLESLQIVQICVHSWQSYVPGLVPILSAQARVQSPVCSALPQLCLATWRRTFCLVEVLATHEACGYWVGSVLLVCLFGW